MMAIKKLNSLHLARKFVRGHYLFREANSFPRAKLKENRELQGTDNVQGKISENTFAPNGGYTVFIILPIFFATRWIFSKLGNISGIFPSFSWGIFSHVTSSDQSCERKYLMDYK